MPPTSGAARCIPGCLTLGCGFMCLVVAHSPSRSRQPAGPSQADPRTCPFRWVCLARVGRLRGVRRLSRCRLVLSGLAVRLPVSVVEALGLQEGDDIEIEVADRRAFEIRKKPEARELLARLRQYRGRLPADFKFDRLEAHERG